MNDDDQPDLDPDLAPDLAPADDARIRALLADLGSTEATGPVPPEVAARLDDTLAGLVAEQQAARMSQERPATGTVVPLRPRWMPRVAAAAAAIIVLGGAGVAAKTLGPLGGGGGSADSSSAGSQADTAEKSAPQDAAGGDSASSGGGGGTALRGEALPQLGADTFAADVRDLLQQDTALRSRAREDAAAPSPTGGQTRSPAPSTSPSTSQYAVGCAGPSVSDGSTTTRVEYAGEPAVLVVHPARKGARLVEAWACDGRHRLASTTVAP